MSHTAAVEPGIRHLAESARDSCQVDLAVLLTLAMANKQKNTGFLTNYDFSQKHYRQGKPLLTLYQYELDMTILLLVLA